MAAARHLRPPRAQPEAARGAGPGRRPQTARGREGGAECPRVRPQPRGQELREGALPRMPLESGLPRPASRPTTPGPARLCPDYSGADLKVPLSSRSSGEAAARCLLWDIARRDSLAAGGRAVRRDVLTPRVGRCPRGALQRRRRLLDSLFSPGLRPSCEGAGRRRSLGAVAPSTPPRCRAAGHTPSRAPPTGPRVFWAPGPASPFETPPLSQFRLFSLYPVPSLRPADSQRLPPTTASAWPHFCVLKRRRFPAPRGGLLGVQLHSV